MMKNAKKFGAFAAMAAAVVMCALEARATTNFSGRVEIVANISGVGNINMAETADTVVHQQDYSVVVTSGNSCFGHPGYSAAWLLDGGSLSLSKTSTTFDGSYVYLRQTGGTSYFYECVRDANAADALPGVLMFGGDSTSTLSFNSSKGYCGELTLAVMGDSYVKSGVFKSAGCAATDYPHIFAINGGFLDVSPSANSTNLYFSYNGGIHRAPGQGGSRVYGCMGNRGRNWIRVYEAGGCVVFSNESTSTDNYYLDPPPLRAPDGNVIQSIGLTEELRNATWQTPPAVVIKGSGSNAVAVVDYDYASCKITNITVVCRGEGYSGAVTANLAYKKGDKLLNEDLVCEVGECQGGDFTFIGDGRCTSVRIGSGITNTYAGATIVDMDRQGRYDHRDTDQYGGTMNWYRHMFSSGSLGGFPNSTNLILKSGCFVMAGISAAQAFPSCNHAELYGGHIAYSSASVFSFKEMVVGGETWLKTSDKSNPKSSTFRVPNDGILWVDYGAVVTNGVIVTPTLKYGTVSFYSRSKIKVKNWEKIPRGRKTVILDLSEVVTFTSRDTATLVQPEDGEGVIFWGSEEGVDDKKLYARRRSDGMLLIFN